MTDANGEPPLLEPGAALVPGYTVLSHVARGHVLDIYEVWSDEREAMCIAKTLRPDCLDNPSDQKLLAMEARILLRLTHPHIVRAYELVKDPQPVALILETLDGATLSYLIKTRGRLSAAELSLLGLQLTSAMRYLHRHGYLHRDLKPSNIVAHNGIAKVIDLSLACRPSKRTPGTGTQIYLAPEQADGRRLTAATDVWGIGVVLYEAAAGKRAFKEFEDEEEYPQLERRAASVRTRRRLPATLARVIDACLEPKQEDRPTIDELLDVFRGLSNELAPPRAQSTAAEAV
jgi:serine/threonine protein kinase